MPVADTQRAFSHASLDGENLMKKGLVGLRERSELLHSHGSISGVLAPVGQHAEKVEEKNEYEESCKQTEQRFIAYNSFCAVCAWCSPSNSLNITWTSASLRIPSLSVSNMSKANTSEYRKDMFCQLG